MEKPMVNSRYLLEKYPGKGGWTYAIIPEILPDSNAPFGWVQVKGSIDGYHLKNYKLMPMGKGRLFLPVKAAIRKIIGKQSGDYVHVILYPDYDPINIPEELAECLREDPVVYETFVKYSDGKKKVAIDWIYGARTMETKANRIAELFEKLKRQNRSPADHGD